MIAARLGTICSLTKSLFCSEQGWIFSFFIIEPSKSFYPNSLKQCALAMSQDLFSLKAVNCLQFKPCSWADFCYLKVIRFMPSYHCSFFQCSYVYDSSQARHQLGLDDKCLLLGMTTDFPFILQIMDPFTHTLLTRWLTWHTFSILLKKLLFKFTQVF